jgi:flagellar biosynthetic protein FliP
MTSRAFRARSIVVLGALLLGIGLAVGVAHAATPPDLAGEVLKQDYSPALRNLVALSLLSLIPVLLVGMTSFTRIVIVLSLLRHALGLPQTPPNSVIVTLAICLTYFSMAPVIDQVNTTALQPYLASAMTTTQAMDKAAVPFRRFMVGQTRQSDLQAVLEMAHAPQPRTIDDIRFSQLLPAFLLSELKTAFQIGFVIFLPFLLIDLVVGAVLMALGMIMVPPATISLPLKILLFILIDGWVLVSKALLSSYWT